MERDKTAWQPIETAPQDRRVMVWKEATGIYISEFEDGEWPMHGWGRRGGVWYPRPTHWMPLPEPPR